MTPPQIIHRSCINSTPLFFYQILAEFRDVAHAVGKLEQTHVVLEVGMPCRAFVRMDLGRMGPLCEKPGASWGNVSGDGWTDVKQFSIVFYDNFISGWRREVETYFQQTKSGWPLQQGFTGRGLFIRRVFPSSWASKLMRRVGLGAPYELGMKWLKWLPRKNINHANLPIGTLNQEQRKWNWEVRSCFKSVAKGKIKHLTRRPWL